MPCRWHQRDPSRAPALGVSSGPDDQPERSAHRRRWAGLAGVGARAGRRGHPGHRPGGLGRRSLGVPSGLKPFRDWRPGRRRRSSPPPGRRPASAILDFVDSQSALFTSVPQLTNRQLVSWSLATLDVRTRYPGTIGFGFVQRVPATRSGRLRSHRARRPAQLRDDDRSLHRRPADPAPVYCLQRYSMVLDVERMGAIPPTFDFCGPTIPGGAASPLPPILTEAARPARPPSCPAASYPSTRSLGDLFIVFDPTFSTGAVPRGGPPATPTSSAGPSGPSVATRCSTPCSVRPRPRRGRRSSRWRPRPAHRGRRPGSVSAIGTYSLVQTTAVDQGVWRFQVTETLEGNPWGSPW